MQIPGKIKARHYKYYESPKRISDIAQETIAFVLAGGEGTRLKDMTAWQAKPAVPFAGQYRIIDFTLSNCINSGIRRISILIQYKSHSLIRHIQQTWGYLRIEAGEYVEVIPAQQRTAKKEWYQGTADAIYQNIDIIRQYEPEYILILGGDHIYNMDYSSMLQQHVSSGSGFTVGCVEMPVGCASAFGVMEVDPDGNIIDFVEKPSRPVSVPGKEGMALVSMGVYVVSRQFLFDVLAQDAEDANSSHDFGKDIIPGLIRAGNAMAHSFVNEQGKPAYWRDVGTIDSYWAASMELCDVQPELDLYDPNWPIRTYNPGYPPAKFIFDETERRGEAIDSLVSSGSIISGAHLKHSVVCIGCKIEGPSHIEDSVILPRVEIGMHCLIRKAIICEGCIIPSGTKIGIDPELDRQYFHITSENIVLVTAEMVERYAARAVGLLPLEVSL